MYHGLTFVALAGLEPEALKLQLLGHSLVTTPALGKKKISPPPWGRRAGLRGPTNPRLALSSVRSQAE